MDTERVVVLCIVSYVAGAFTVVALMKWLFTKLITVIQWEEEKDYNG